MSPTPKMVIETPLAKRKGVIEIGNLADLDTLRAELAEAEAMIRGAQGAIRPAPVDAARCPEVFHDGDRRFRCVKFAGHDPDVPEAERTHDDAGGWQWQGRDPGPGDGAEPALCGHPRNADGECGAACDVPAPLATVTTLVPAAERQADARFTVAGPAPVTVLINGEPVEVQPCPNVYPETGEPCIGLFDHEPPCRGVEAGEWVPAVTPVTA